MKKTISLLCVGLVLTTASFAQKGSVLVAGILSFQDDNTPANSLNSENAQHAWTLGISPQIGYQFSNAWTAGILGGYTHSEQRESNPALTNSANYWDLGPFLRYTRPITSWVSFYGEFNGIYADQGQEANSLATYGHQYALAATVFPALFFNVKNGFGINVNFGGVQYSYSHRSGVGNTGTSFGLTFGNTAVIGISKNFGGHKAG